MTSVTRLAWPEFGECGKLLYGNRSASVRKALLSRIVYDRRFCLGVKYGA